MVLDAESTAGFRRGTVAHIPCHVCGRPLADGGSALCSKCDRSFHLRAREDEDGDDCGAVWMNDQWLTLEFACNTCLGKGADEPPIGTAH